jgi:3'-phosphoadenosine 5'-phosphosulfate sulfotransferase (PAPS reductase)/FAD synthetase
MPSKLQLAHTRAARVSKLSGGSLLVGLSGKDSFVTLDLATKHFDRVACFHMYHVRGMRCEEAPLEAVCRRYQVPLFYVPHPDLCRMLKHAVYRTHIAKLDKMPALKKGDCERIARKKSGLEWIAYGERLADSFARRLFWRKLELQGIYEPGKRCTLIPDWLNADVAGYFNTLDVPEPCTFNQTTTGTGFALTKPVLSWLRAKHPDDYTKVLAVFPAAAAVLAE